MNTKEIDKILEKAIDREDARFLGVYSRDLLPRSISEYPACLVLNSDPSDEPGSHWLALYFPSSTCCDFFDSYAHDPMHYGIHSPLLSRLVISNHKQVQALDSNVCGQHCIYFLTLRSQGFSMPTIVNQLTHDNYRGNDRYVAHYVNKLIRKPIPMIINKSLTPLHVLQMSHAARII